MLGSLVSLALLAGSLPFSTASPQFRGGYGPGRGGFGNGFQPFPPYNPPGYETLCTNPAFYGYADRFGAFPLGQALCSIILGAGSTATVTSTLALGTATITETVPGYGGETTVTLPTQTITVVGTVTVTYTDGGAAAATTSTTTTITEPGYVGTGTETDTVTETVTVAYGKEQKVKNHKRAAEPQLPGPPGAVQRLGDAVGIGPEIVSAFCWCALPYVFAVGTATVTVTDAQYTTVDVTSPGYGYGGTATSTPPPVTVTIGSTVTTTVAGGYGGTVTDVFTTTISGAIVTTDTTAYTTVTSNSAQCPITNAATCTEADGTVDGTAYSYGSFYAGCGATEDANNPGDQQTDQGPPQTTQLAGYQVTDDCSAIDACGSYAFGLSGGYYSFDVHWLISEAYWECIAYYNPANPDPSPANTYFNDTNSDVGQVYAYDLLGPFPDS